MKSRKKSIQWMTYVLLFFFSLSNIFLGSIPVDAATPGVNLLVNPGFEQAGLAGWTTTGSTGVASQISGSAGYNYKSGQYSLRHLKSSAYEAWTYQIVTGLADGIYTASAWVRRPNTATAHEIAQMEVFVGNCTVGSSTYNYKKSISTTTLAAFEQITISNIVVKDGAGQATIAFHSKTPASGPVLYIDDVEFKQVTSYTVTFATDGGSSVESVQVAEGNTVQKPADPTKSGYLFGGWYSDSQLTTAFNFATPITANTTLYAKWKPIFPVDPDNFVQNPSFEKPTLESWQITSNLPSTATVSEGTYLVDYRSGTSALKLTQSSRYEAWVTQTVTGLEKGYYTAKAWVKRPVAVRSDDVFRMQVIGYGDTAKTAAIPGSSEFTQITIENILVTTGKCTVEFYVKTLDNHILYIDDVELKKTGTPFTSLVANFDTCGGSRVSNVIADSTRKFTPPAPPVKTGYTFAGWYKDSAYTQPYDFTEPITTDVLLYAKWQNSTLPMIGNIRWDVITGYAPFDELNSLSLEKYNYRAPFFTSVDANFKVTGNNNSVAAMEQEINYAVAGGIDYWAFTTGPELGKNNAEYYALDKFLSTDQRSKIGFSILLHRYNDTPWENRIDMLVKWMQEPNYVQVLGNRPLLYIYRVSELEAKYGAGSGTQAAINLIRSKAQAAGLANPYIVAMASSTPDSLAQNKGYVETYGLDAISAYSYAGERNSNNVNSYAPYRELATQNIASWENYKATGKKMIPLVALGRNEETRKDTPVVYGGGQGPYFDNPTPYEVASQIIAGLDYVKNNATVCESNSILSYAWNEFAEGGWICPTLSEGTSKLDAIYQMKIGNLGGSNLLANPSFEASLSGWTNTGTTSAVTVIDEVYYGDHALQHYHINAYQAETSQEVTDLPNGLYKLVARVKSSGGQNSAVMSLSDGTNSVTKNITASQAWTQISLTLTVTSGESTIRFTSDANAGNWLMVDCVEFYRIALSSGL